MKNPNLITIGFQKPYNHLISWLGLIVYIVTSLGLVSCKREDKVVPKRVNLGAIEIEVQSVQPRKFQETITAVGTLIANESVSIRSERSAIVQEIFFQEGDALVKGQMLMKMDDSMLLPQLQRAEAQRKLAVTLEERQRGLVSSRSISELDFAQTQANARIAESEVNLIKSQMAKTEILAPFDGIAGLRNVSVGSYLTPDVEICTFQDLRSLKLDFHVPERYAAQVMKGQRLQFTVAGREHPFQAEVVAIEPAVDASNRNMKVRALVPNPDNLLMAGAFASVELVLQESPDALLIPAMALVPGLKSDQIFVYKDGVVEKRQVIAGGRTDEFVHIVHGLEAGEKVAVTGALQLRDGMKTVAHEIDNREKVSEVSTVTAGQNL